MFKIYNQNTIQNVLTIVEFPLIPMKIQIFLFADDAISPIGQYIEPIFTYFYPSIFTRNSTIRLSKDQKCSRELHLRAGSLKIHLFHSFSKQIFNKNDK